MGDGLDGYRTTLVGRSTHFALQIALLRFRVSTSALPSTIFRNILLAMVTSFAANTIAISMATVALKLRDRPVCRRNRR